MPKNRDGTLHEVYITLGPDPHPADLLNRGLAPAQVRRLRWARWMAGTGRLSELRASKTQEGRDGEAATARP